MNILENGKKILEKSGNFVSPEKWEPCETQMVHASLTTGIGAKDYPIMFGGAAGETGVFTLTSNFPPF